MLHTVTEFGCLIHQMLYGSRNDRMLQSDLQTALGINICNILIHFVNWLSTFRYIWVCSIRI